MEERMEENKLSYNHSKKPFAPANLLGSRRNFAVQQTRICCTAERIPQGSKTKRATGEWGTGSLNMSFHRMYAECQHVIRINERCGKQFLFGFLFGCSLA